MMLQQRNTYSYLLVSHLQAFPARAAREIAYQNRLRNVRSSTSVFESDSPIGPRKRSIGQGYRETDRARTHRSRQAKPSGKRCEIYQEVPCACMSGLNMKYDRPNVEPELENTVMTQLHHGYDGPTCIMSANVALAVLPNSELLRQLNASTPLQN